ncbi:MAG: hypothetical protein B6D41_00960 [Chloroflexi bacterium UTCFX4]|jgi:thiamine kinase-like enzyme|nr:MAG: hypothetical protein B6D41_00960 [Chloroflexi bacterium UTCFX4]
MNAPLTIVQRYLIGVPNEDGFFQLRSLANRVWSFETSSGRFILKEYLTFSADQVERSQMLQSSFRSFGVNIPSVVPNADGFTVTTMDDRVFEIVRYIPHIEMGHQNQTLTLSRLQQAARQLALIHTSPSSSFRNLLSCYNISNIISRVTTLELEFCSEFERLCNQCNSDSAIRLRSLRQILIETAKERQQILWGEREFSFANASILPTHGDFSLSNLLFASNDGKLYVIDWDNAQFRPLAWELQRTVALLCGKGKVNANLDEIDYARASVFLSAYADQVPIDEKTCKQMIEVAEFCYLVYWLDFTLSKLLQHDFRVLSLIPDSPDDALFWKFNLPYYKEFLLNAKRRLHSVS